MVGKRDAARSAGRGMERGTRHGTWDFDRGADISQGRQKGQRYGYLSDKIEGTRTVVDLIAVGK